MLHFCDNSYGFTHDIAVMEDKIDKPSCISE